MGTQGLLDTSIGTTALVDDLYMMGRVLLLGVWHDHHTYDDEYAATLVLGLEYPVLEHGKLSCFIEQHMPTNSPWQSAIHGNLSIEFWP